MASLFIPTSNVTGAGACTGIEERQAMRPPPGEYYNSVLIGLDVACSSIFLLSLPALWWLRHEPRFSKIRPFSLSSVLIVLAVVYFQGCLLPPLLSGFPCILELFFHVFGSVVATSVTALRVLVFVIESQYSLLASSESATVIREQSSSRSSVGPQEEETHQSFIFLFTEVLRVGFGFQKIEKLTLDILADIRRRYLQILLTISCPPLVIFAIGVLSVPAYRGNCNDCGITMEFFLIVLCSPTIFLIFIIRMIIIGSRYRQDEQKVMQEIFLTILLAPWWIYIGYALLLADPGLAAFNRVFAWNVLVCIGPLFFWTTVIALQIVQALRYRHEKLRLRETHASTASKSFVEECDADENLRREFHAFVASRYAIEFINFIDDVKTYKNRFEDQPEKWRRTKAKRIVVTYINDGSPQQINISATQRESVVTVDVEKAPLSRLFSLFDATLQEAIHVVHTGMWLEFRNRKKLMNTNVVVAL